MLGNLKWFLNHITFWKKKAIKVNMGVGGEETRCIICHPQNNLYSYIESSLQTQVAKT